MILVIIDSMVILAIKVISVASALFTDPIETIGIIPTNWRKVVLCTDMGVMPEIIPGIEQTSGLITWKLSRFKGYLMNPRGWSVDGRFILLFIHGVLTTIAAAIYRFSLKSTALIWSPLLWAVKPITSREEVIVTLKRIKEQPMIKAGRAYSLIVVSAFAAKLWLLYEWITLKSHYAASKILVSLEPYIVPDQIPIWHVASVCNAVLTVVVVYGLAVWYLKEAEIGAEIPTSSLRIFLNTVFTLRNLLTIYTSLCALYITVQTAAKWDLPPLKARLFPWS
jgi:hypothetical protein